jgi:predicted nucleic acid-binding protein
VLSAVPEMLVDTLGLDTNAVSRTALAEQAQWIVTGDKPLLSVVEYQGVRLVQVSEAVQSLGG